MLETAEGIQNCEVVAAVDGIDVLLIGSGDLTTDLGIPGARPQDFSELSVRAK